jgi:hypothetical protein
MEDSMMMRAVQDDRREERCKAMKETTMSVV